jgi:CHAD domain-containing protein
VSFELKPHQSAVRRLRRLVRKEIDKALEGLGRTAEAADDAVHDARKRFKKVRAVLKLARGGLGEKLYARENARFRDAGRPLTAVRDAKVLVETFDNLVRDLFGDRPDPPFGEVREALLVSYEEVKRDLLYEGDVLEGVAGAVRAGRRRVRRWDFGGWSVVGPGLKRGYERAAEAFEVARAEPSVEKLHECRKRVKDLWHQLQLVKPAHPEVLEGMADLAHELADALGDDHNLFVLGRFLTDEPHRPGAVEALGVLAEPIARRRAELQRRAFDLGPELFDAPAPAFARRLKGYWRGWRGRPQPAGT